MNLRMLSKMRRPSSTAATMVAKLSSRRTRLDASRATSVPACPHGHADIGARERGRVVDAVACHCHVVAMGLDRFDNADLLCGIQPREDFDMLDACGKVGLGQRRELASAHHPVAVPEHAESPGDRPRGGGVVAGDHDRGDAG